MKPLYWSQRETLIPDYTLDTLKPKEAEILEVFESVKNMAIKQYNLEGLNNEEIEETLFKMYSLQAEEFKDDIDKIILLEYADNFLKYILDPLTQMLNAIKPNTEFKDNQNLFKAKQELTILNRNLTQDSFNKYFYTLENGILISKIDGQEKTSEDDFLEEIKDKEDNLFEEVLPKNPEIRSKHYMKESNYDINYWKGYIRYIEVQHQELEDYFKAKAQYDDIVDFRKTANLYYLYASYYKMVNELNTEKRKTI